MSREIKFRVWDKVCGSMITEGDPDYFKIYLNGSMVIGGAWATNEVELMQYTGFKDNNNIDIYEGDIFKVLVDDSDINYVVFWDHISAGFKVKPLKSYLTAIQSIGEFVHLGIEVIGNIYEGIKKEPEGLEKKVLDLINSKENDNGKSTENN